jgi:multiple sugar transport system substrate-binding protein
MKLDKSIGKAAVFGLAALAWLSLQQTSASAQEVSFMVFGDPAEKAAYAELATSFMAKHPEIKVQITHIPGQADYRKRMAADFAAGTPADVTLINYRRYAGFAAKDVLEPLGPYLDKSTAIKAGDFYAEAMTPYNWKGTTICLPQNLSSLVVYYNKNLFDAAGIAHPSDDWTWDDFVTTAKALTKDTDGDGATDQFGIGTEASIFRLAPMIWQNGGDIVDDPANPKKLTLDTPAAKEALQWFVDLQMVHKVMPDRVNEASEDSETRFQNGRLGMFLNSRRGVPAYREITAFGWDVAPLPMGKQKAGILHADAFCMAKATKDKASTWTFIEYAMSAEGQTILAKSGRTVPSMKSVANSPAFLDPTVAPSRSKVFLDGIAHIRAVPIMESWVDIEGAAGKELERGVFGDATVDEVIAAATENTKDFFPH